MKKISCIAVILLLFIFVSAACEKSRTDSESASDSFEATIAALQTQVVESAFTATPTPTLTPTPENIYEATIAALQTQVAEPNAQQNTESPNKADIADYSSLSTDELIDANTSYIEANLINLSEQFVISKLEELDVVTEVEAATEEHDPNGNLHKQGGYTAAIYFTTTFLDPSDIRGDTIVDKGTKAGGQIEVYATAADAEKRNTYLSKMDGTIVASGSHRVLGSMLIRTSDNLTATKQKELERIIVEKFLGYTDAVDENVTATPDTQETSRTKDLDFITTGATVTFGRYEQDNDPTNGDEPIKWIVLEADDDKCLLLSKYLLEPMAYDEGDETTWKDSSLRNWLNNDFLSTAFNKSNQSFIISSQLTNSDNPDYETDGGADTTDKIFLLSWNEILLYFTYIEDLKCQLTDTAQRKLYDIYIASDLGPNTSDYEEIYEWLTQFNEAEDGKLFWWWWLRTPGLTTGWASKIQNDGYPDLDGSVASSTLGAVRPALWLDLNALRAYYENGGSTIEAGKPEKNGFAAGKNNLVNIGAFTIEVPDYWDASDNDGSKYLAYAETGGKVAMLTMVASYDSEDPVTFDILKRETDNGNMAAFVASSVDEAGSVSDELIEIDGIKGYIYNTTFVQSGAPGKLTMVCLPSVSDNKWIYIYLFETDNTEYSYSDDFRKIIHSLKR